MKILAYFAFTLLSVVIQFGVMEFIQERIQLELEDKRIYTNTSRIKRNNKEKSNALFYRTDSWLNDFTSVPTENQTSTVINTDLPSSDTLTSTSYDVILEDDDVTDVPVTSELPLTSTEYENITDFSIFSKKNTTIIKPDLKPTKHQIDNCHCNFLYNICDVNCCCDMDCSRQQVDLFNCSVKRSLVKHDFLCSSNSESNFNGINDLFCIAKTNLPEKRDRAHSSYGLEEVERQSLKFNKWRHFAKDSDKLTFTKKPYSSGDPVWLLRNGTVAYLDVPLASLNNFCGRRKAVRFLKNEEFKCTVTMKDIEMLNVINRMEQSLVVSVLPENKNSTIMNCSTLACTEWKIVVCNESTCTNYNKTQHDPVCTGESVCTNLALNMEYVFYFNNFTITNATIYLHLENSIKQTFTQHINVKFYMTDIQVEDTVVQLSGNPGYDTKLPVIVSFAEQNHTDIFYNKIFKLQNVFIYPKNVKGLCIKNNLTHNKLEFNVNKRSKCRFHVSANKSNICESIQSNLVQYMGLNRKKIWISPLGNPHSLNEDEWIIFKMPELLPVGQILESSKVYCENLISTLSLTFGFANIGDEESESNHILAAYATVITQNATFDLDDISTDLASMVLTFETLFIDVTKPPDYTYAAGPHLNIRLPNDFFFPFPSNSASVTNLGVLVYLVSLIYNLK